MTRLLMGMVALALQWLSHDDKKLSGFIMYILHMVDIIDVNEQFPWKHGGFQGIMQIIWIIKGTCIKDDSVFSLWKKSYF